MSVACSRRSDGILASKRSLVEEYSVRLLLFQTALSQEESAAI